MLCAPLVRLDLRDLYTLPTGTEGPLSTNAMIDYVTTQKKNLDLILLPQNVRATRTYLKVTITKENYFHSVAHVKKQVTRNQ
jgi:hypothetical protein